MANEQAGQSIAHCIRQFVCVTDEACAEVVSVPTRPFCSSSSAVTSLNTILNLVVDVSILELIFQYFLLAVFRALFALTRINFLLPCSAVPTY